MIQILCTIAAYEAGKALYRLMKMFVSTFCQQDAQRQQAEDETKNLNRAMLRICMGKRDHGHPSAGKGQV